MVAKINVEFARSPTSHPKLTAGLLCVSSCKMIDSHKILGHEPNSSFEWRDSEMNTIRIDVLWKSTIIPSRVVVVIAAATAAPSDIPVLRTLIDPSWPSNLPRTHARFLLLGRIEEKVII